MSRLKIRNPETGEWENAGGGGADGVSATHEWNGTVLTMTSASGTSSADLKGERGLTGPQGPQGVPGVRGPQGPQGENGYSPKIELTRIDGGVQIEVTNKYGKQTETVYDGKNGSGAGADLTVDDDGNATLTASTFSVDADGNAMI